MHSRYPLAATHTHDLPSPGEPRVMGEAKLEGDAWSVFVTHLSLGKKGRLAQIAHIADTLRERRRAVLMMIRYDDAEPRIGVFSER